MERGDTRLWKHAGQFYTSSKYIYHWFFNWFFNTIHLRPSFIIYHSPFIITSLHPPSFSYFLHQHHHHVLRNATRARQSNLRLLVLRLNLERVLSFTSPPGIQPMCQTRPNPYSGLRMSGIWLLWQPPHRPKAILLLLLPRSIPPDLGSVPPCWADCLLLFSAGWEGVPRCFAGILHWILRLSWMWWVGILGRHWIGREVDREMVWDMGFTLVVELYGFDKTTVSWWLFLNPCSVMGYPVRFLKFKYLLFMSLFVFLIAIDRTVAMQ